MADRRDDTQQARDALTDWAQELANAPHHARCASQLDKGAKACDCYKTLRVEYPRAEAVLALVAEHDRYKNALTQIATDERVPRPPGPLPPWCSERSPFATMLDKSEIARAALAGSGTGE